MADKQPFPDSLKQMATRDGMTKEQIADYIGVHPTELDKQYDLSGVEFPAAPKTEPAPE